MLQMEKRIRKGPVIRTTRLRVNLMHKRTPMEEMTRKAMMETRRVERAVVEVAEEATVVKTTQMMKTKEKMDTDQEGTIL